MGYCYTNQFFFYKISVNYDSNEYIKFSFENSDSYMKNNNEIILETFYKNDIEFDSDDKNHGLPYDKIFFFKKMEK